MSVLEPLKWLLESYQIIVLYQPLVHYLPSLVLDSLKFKFPALFQVNNQIPCNYSVKTSEDCVMNA